MPDYKQLYFALFRKVTAAIDLLEQAQIEAEELYLSQSEPEIKPFPCDCVTEK